MRSVNMTLLKETLEQSAHMVMLAEQVMQKKREDMMLLV